MSIEGVLARIEAALTTVSPATEVTPPTQSGVPISRFVEGLDSEVELRGELEALGYTGLRQDRLVLAAQLKRQLALFLDARALWRKMARDGELTLAEFTALLETAGIPQESILMEQQALAAQKPAVTLAYAEVGITVSRWTGVPTRPQEEPTEIGLGILSAEVVDRVAGLVASADISLAVVQVEAAPVAGAEVPVEISLAVVSVAEAPLEPATTVLAAISLAILAAEVVPEEVVRVQSVELFFDVFKAEVMENGT